MPPYRTIPSNEEPGFFIKVKNCKFFSQKKSIIENVLNSSLYNEGFLSKHLGECKNIYRYMKMCGMSALSVEILDR